MRLHEAQPDRGRREQRREVRHGRGARGALRPRGPRGDEVRAQPPAAQAEPADAVRPPPRASRRRSTWSSAAAAALKLDDEVVDVAQWDAVRVAPEVMRALRGRARRPRGGRLRAPGDGLPTRSRKWGGGRRDRQDSSSSLVWSRKPAASSTRRSRSRNRRSVHACVRLPRRDGGRVLERGQAVLLRLVVGLAQPRQVVGDAPRALLLALGRRVPRVLARAALRHARAGA